jgi:hypothetical protein
VELRWEFGEAGQFVETRLERATALAGPWTQVVAEAREEGGATIVLDRGVTAGGSYWYRLVTRTPAGEPMVFGPVAAKAGEAIQRFELAAIWPNPTKRLTHVDFAVARETSIRLSVMDVQGREVAVLAEGNHRPGRYQAVWTGQTPRGLAPVGLYFVRYQVPGRVLLGRIVLAR